MGGCTPIGGMVKGAAAGAFGTLAMDLVWYGRYRRGGGADAFPGWELSSGLASFDDAPAPARVGRLAAASLGIELPDRLARVTNNVVHWAAGIQWGAGYGMASCVLGRSTPLLGLVLGPVAWGTSYAALGRAGIYRPMREYDGETLRKDLGAHLVFGLVTATVFRLLGRR